MRRTAALGRRRITWALAVSALFSTAGFAQQPHQVIRVPHEGGRHKPPVMTDVCVQPGGKLLAAVGDDHCVRIWDRDSGALLHCLEEHTDWAKAAAFSPDGTVLATAGNDGQVIFWDPLSGAAKQVFAKHNRAIANLEFRPDGARLAVLGFDDHLHLYEVNTGTRLMRLGCPCRDMHALAFSPDGALLAAGGRNGRLRVWRLSDGTVLHETNAHSLRIRDIVFSSDGAFVISAGDDRAIRVAEAATGREVFVLPTGACKVYCLALLPNGRLASGGSDNRISLWDLPRREIVGWLDGHTGTVTALAIGGERLASVGYDTTLRLWPTHPTPAIAGEREQERVGLLPETDER